MQEYELFTKETKTFFYNLKERPIQLMLDFDFMCKREACVSAIIHPGKTGFHKAFFGKKEILIPIYSTIQEATQKHPNTTCLINFASFRSAFDSSKQALETKNIKSVTIVAEGIPERQTRELIAIAQNNNKTIIGPATVGAIVAGQFRIGNAGGLNDNIIRCKLYRPGSVGLVSTSGGMMNEFFNMIARASDGIYEGVAIGGDQFPGSTLLEHMLRFEKNPNIKMVVSLGEIGGQAEYEIANALKEKRITKPLIMWVSGTCASIFPYNVQFGHAGAKSGNEQESAQAKNQTLKEAGVIVPNGFEEMENTIAQVFNKLVQEGKITVKQEESTPSVPQNYEELAAQGKIRRRSHFTCTISSELGDEPTYNGIKLSDLVNQNATIGNIIGLLWFKKELPDYFTKFIDLCILLTADHGPAVATAHNSIVASRAGKDIITSLIAGLSTIGDRHGGAIDDAARYFKKAKDATQSAHEFVEEMKKQGKYIPGIGHRIKSKKNPDKRVEMLIAFAKKHFPATQYLEYALEVEKTTLQKAENLILNVDGAIGALFLDAMSSCDQFTTQEVAEVIKIGYLNGLFALARSIGMIGHILDQKRLGEPMYRHPSDDILYSN